MVPPAPPHRSAVVVIGWQAWLTTPSAPCSGRKKCPKWASALAPLPSRLGMLRTLPRECLWAARGVCEGPQRAEGRHMQRRGNETVVSNSLTSRNVTRLARGQGAARRLSIAGPARQHAQRCAREQHMTNRDGQMTDGSRREMGGPCENGTGTGWGYFPSPWRPSGR